MLQKNLFVKLLALLLFKSKGGVLNNYYSLISPKEYKIRRDIKSEDRVDRLIGLISPVPVESNLIRIGSKDDGGYFIPEHDLAKIDYLISGGIENNNDFEIELANLGVKGLQIDNSIEAPPRFHSNLTFKNATIGILGPNSFSINHHLSVLPSNNVLLKLDIEGYEKFAITEIDSDCFSKIRCLVLEIHDVDLISQNSYWILLEKMLLCIFDAGFLPCFVNPNNSTSAVIIGGRAIPRNIEVTFTRRQFMKKVFSLSDLKYLKSLQSKNDDAFSSVNIDHILLHHFLLPQ